MVRVVQEGMVKLSEEGSDLDVMGASIDPGWDLDTPEMVAGSFEILASAKSASIPTPRLITSGLWLELAVAPGLVSGTALWASTK